MSYKVVTGERRFQLLVFDRLVPLWRRIDKSLPWPPTSIIGIGVRDD
jgi:hypothetical protein